MPLVRDGSQMIFGMPLGNPPGVQVPAHDDGGYEATADDAITTADSTNHTADGTP